MSTPTSLRRTLRALRLSVLALAILGFAPGSAAADHRPATCSGQNTSNICVHTADEPDPVQISDATGQRWVHLIVTVSNAGGNPVNHVNLSVRVPTAAAGDGTDACTSNGETVSFALGKLSPGTQVVRHVQMCAPTAAGTVTTHATASYAEGAKDDPNAKGKPDAVTDSETTTARTDAAATYVPAGQPATVTSDPDPTVTSDDAHYIRADIEPQAFSTTASVDDTPDTPEDQFSFHCLLNTVRLNNTDHFCRGGGWVEADLHGTSDSITFNPPVTFTVRWDKSTVSVLQSEDNFVLFHRNAHDDSAGAVTEVYSRCKSPVVAPCLTQARRLGGEDDGDWEAVLLSDENGYMR